MTIKTGRAGRRYSRAGIAPMPATHVGDSDCCINAGCEAGLSPCGYVGAGCPTGSDWCGTNPDGTAMCCSKDPLPGQVATRKRKRRRKRRPLKRQVRSFLR